MPTYNELIDAAISRYEKGDAEGGERLEKQALDQEQSNALIDQAITAFESGDAKAGDSLEAQAKALSAPYETSTFTDIGRGMVAAPVTVAQGITEMAAAGLDLSLGTQYSRPVTDAFEGFKREYDLDPKTAAGEITEELLGFGLGFIPIAGWLGRANSVAKAGKLTKAGSKSKFFKSAEKFGESAAGKSLLKSRAGLIGSTALATAGYETIVTPDGRATMSDAFDIMPLLQTEDTSQMQGFELAYTRLRNKLRRGVEGGLASLTFDVGLPVVGAASRAFGTVPGVSGVTSLLARSSAEMFNAIGSQVGRIPGVGVTKQFLKEQLSATGTKFAPMLEEVLDVDAVGAQAQRTALNFVTEFENATGQFLKFVDAPKKSKKKLAQINDDLYRFLTVPGSTALDNYSKGAKTAADRMLELDITYQDAMIDELEQRIALGSTNQDLAGALEEIQNHRKSGAAFLRRRFRQYDDKEKFYKELDLEGPAFNAAYKELRNVLGSTSRPQRELTEIQKLQKSVGDYVAEPAPFTSAELDSIATEKLYEYIGLQGAKDLPEAKKMLAELQKSFARGQSEVIKEGRAVGIAEDMFIKKIEGLDQLDALRALKGEIVDPKKVFINTISDMANTLAGLNFYRNAAGTFGKDMEEGLRLLDEGKFPSIIKDFDRTVQTLPDVGMARGVPGLPGAAAVRNIDEKLKGLGYIRLGVDESGQVPDDIFGGKFADLTGAYVRPEVKDALTTPARMGLDGMGQAAAIGATLKGQAQRMAIVPNPISQVRNIYGNLMYLAGNGNLKRDSDFVDTFRLIAANVEHMDDAGFARMSQELGSLGVMDTSLVTSALRDYKDFAQKFSVSGQISNAFDKFSKAVPFMKQFEALYSDSDSFFKLMAVFAEQSKMTNALGKAGLDINDAMSLPVGFRATFAQNLMDAGLAKRAGSLAVTDSPGNLLLTMAGDTVKDTMPVYSRIGKAVRKLDAIPVFGNFTSFASENIRNSYNTMNRGMKELAFVASDDLVTKIGKEKATILERQIRGMGSQRLMSFLAVSAATPVAVTKASMLATGTTQEEMDAAESLVADFYQGHALGVINNDGRGNIQLFDQSFVNPYGFVRDPIINALRTYEKKGGLNASEVEQLTAASWAGITGYLEPFGSESIIFERARDVLPAAWLGRGGETQTGSKVYQEGESLGSKVAQGVTHMLSAYIPGYGRMFAEERGGQIEYGRLTRGVTGIPGTRGQEYNPQEELARAVTGFTPITLNLRTDFQFKGGEYLPLRSSAKSVASRTIKNADSTVEQMTSSWGTYLDNLYREQSKLYYNVLQAKKLNASDQVIRSQLKAAGLGTAELNAIIRGEFWPGLATKELIVEVRKDMRNEDRAPRVVQDIPFGDFNRMSNDVRNRPLSPQIGVLEREARLADRQRRRDQEIEAATANLAPPQPVVAPQPVAAPTTPPESQSFMSPIANVVSGVADTVGDMGANAVDRYKTYAPSVLGGNPAAQAANEEILRRSQQGQ